MQEVEVYRGAAAPGRREMIEAALRDDGIDCVIKSSGGIAAYPMTTGPMGELSVWVLPDDAERATELIEALTGDPMPGAAMPGDAQGDPEA